MNTFLEPFGRASFSMFSRPGKHNFLTRFNKKQMIWSESIADNLYFCLLLNLAEKCKSHDYTALWTTELSQSFCQWLFYTLWNVTIDNQDFKRLNNKRLNHYWNGVHGLVGTHWGRYSITTTPDTVCVASLGHRGRYSITTTEVPHQTRFLHNQKLLNNTMAGGKASDMRT